MENIEKIVSLNKEYASLYIKEALRFYSRNLLQKEQRVLIIEDLKNPFYDIANGYLQWEGEVVKGIIEAIDKEQQDDFTSKLRGDELEETEVDWDTIERNALSEFERDEKD